jgi:hypothetical protein
LLLKIMNGGGGMKSLFFINFFPAPVHMVYCL